jgi:hypothetical protein
MTNSPLDPEKGNKTRAKPSKTFRAENVVSRRGYELVARLELNGI